MTELGRLERVDLRDIWTSEAQDFTPWLAEERNLNILADTLGLELELEAQEQNVGPFRADILCKDTGDGTWVLIENQLERTDHNHLGQLMTYAAGLHAVTIVWIAKTFADEHRAALDWLNDITDDTFRFFGLEVELWKIGDSPAAPKFNVVSKPNDWSRSVNKGAKRIEGGPLTETKAAQLDYWNSLNEHLISENSKIKIKEPIPSHYIKFRIGKTGFLLCAYINIYKNDIGVFLEMYDDNSKEYFWLLQNKKEEIEQELNFRLKWQELPNNKKSEIAIYLHVKNLLDKTAWPDHIVWMKEKLEKFDAVFRPRIQNLNADDWRPDEDADVGE